MLFRSLQERQAKEKLSVIKGANLTDSSKNHLKKISITMALEDLKKATKSFVDLEINEIDLAKVFAVSFIIKQSVGPVLHVAENIDVDDPRRMQELIQVGSLYSVSLGQCQQYFQDLFGPLPFGKIDFRAFIYTSNIKAPENLSDQQKKFIL